MAFDPYAIALSALHETPHLSNHMFLISIREPHECTLTNKKKESIQYICALAHAAPLDGVEIPKAEHSPNLLEVVH